MHRLMVMSVLLAPLALPAVAQEGSAAAERRLNTLMSRYELAIDKLQNAHERLQSDIRSLQRVHSEMQRKLEESNKRAQHVSDEMVRMRNTESLEARASKGPWGERQRDCSELGVKHQQIKVTVKPDGTRGVRYLCFDGKVLHLGSEVYVVEE